MFLIPPTLLKSQISNSFVSSCLVILETNIACLLGILEFSNLICLATHRVYVLISKTGTTKIVGSTVCQRYGTGF